MKYLREYEIISASICIDNGVINKFQAYFRDSLLITGFGIRSTNFVLSFPMQVLSLINTLTTVFQQCYISF